VSQLRLLLALSFACPDVLAQAIKSIQKNGLEAMAREAGLDLWKLPFEDARPERKQYLEENKGKVPVVRERKHVQDCRCLPFTATAVHAVTCFAVV